MTFIYEALDIGSDFGKATVIISAEDFDAADNIHDEHVKALGRTDLVWDTIKTVTGAVIYSNLERTL